MPWWAPATEARRALLQRGIAQPADGQPGGGVKVSFTAGSPDKLVDMDTLRDWECFDADSGKDLAVELREYFIPDFSHWKEHDPFEAAFARLLKDLRAENAAK